MSRTVGPAHYHPPPPIQGLYFDESLVDIPALGPRMLLTCFVISPVFLWMLLKFLPWGLLTTYQVQPCDQIQGGAPDWWWRQMTTHSVNELLLCWACVRGTRPACSEICTSFPKEGPLHESRWQVCIPALRSPGLCVWTPGTESPLKHNQSLVQSILLITGAHLALFCLFSFFLFKNSRNI